MKTLIILSAFLLVLSSCNKDVPVPDPDPDQVYTSDPGQDPDSDPSQDPDDDPDDGDPSGCAVSHPVRTVAFSTATHFNDGSKK
jgi:hypothetical protein